MNSRIIAYSGTHGTGKSTAVHVRVPELKKQFPCLRIESLEENLAWCPLPINAGSTRDTQMWIFTNHIQRELKAMSVYDVVVSDRSAVDAIAYTMAHGWEELAMDMIAMVRHHMPHYSEIIITTTKNNYQHADGLRDVDPVFRAKVEECLFFIYGGLGYFLNTDSHGVLKAVRPDRPGLQIAADL